MAVYVIAFESTHAALAAQDALSSGHVRFRLIPTPRSITAACGMSLQFDAADEDDARLVYWQAADQQPELATLHEILENGQAKMLETGVRA